VRSVIPFPYNLKLAPRRVDTNSGMGKSLNPVEFAIFALVAAGFGLSGYRLFQDREGFETAMLAPMSSNPVSESRNPASAPLVSHVDFSCDSKQEVHVTASKVRINGPICGASPAESAEGLKTSIVNSSNQFIATVFTNSKEGRFSTDYIPLNPEKNSIRIQFSGQAGKTLSHELTLIKD
jgi:hypothetical protein